MLAIFEPFRRPTHEATLPAEDPAQESQTGAQGGVPPLRRPPDTFGAESAIGEPDITEPAPQPPHFAAGGFAIAPSADRGTAADAPQGTAAPCPRMAVAPLPIRLGQRTC